MTHLKTLVVGVAALALCGGAALAQNNSMSSGAMSSGKMNKDNMSSGSMKMSMSDKRTMKSCQAMNHDAMMKSSKCKTFMGNHPDMFNADGTMKDGMTPH